ncbi:MAG: TlpA disulfide reductase family protein [Acidobacteriota bacterium]
MRQLLLAAVLICSAAPSGLARDPATLVLKDLSGSERSLSDYRGRIVVLNFWATWCIPCLTEMPLLASVQHRYATNGVQVIGASADQPKTQKEIPRFISKLKINFPVWVGATTSHMQALGLGEALPATAIIDRDGKIVARIQGVLDKAELERLVEWLIGDRQLPAPSTLVEKLGLGHEHHEKNQAAKPASAQTHSESMHHDHGNDHKTEDHSHHHGHGSENHEHGIVSFDGASSVPS